LESLEYQMFAKTYENRRVLVTGHTGFKGSWLCSWLLELGAQVAGFSLNVPTVPSNFEASHLRERLAHFDGDVRDRGALSRVMEAFKPEMIFHLAAQSLVRLSFGDPILTFETNTLGTLNVLECLRQLDQPLVGVIITSDKCYQNQEWTWGYRENDILGGDDPYSASKACAELIFRAYDRSYLQGEGLRVATTRAGNVVGGGDWAPDRIVPDCMRAWSQGRPALIRHPQATRPWQHVLEPLSGYLWLGAKLWQGEGSLRGESFNFGPAANVNQSVLELVSGLAGHWPGARWEMEPQDPGVHRESTLLKLCCDKALNLLGWQSVLSLPETIRLTAEWYRIYYERSDGQIYEFARRQIKEYVDRAASAGMPWTV
jgi:CDP-glucose 4,6-dehydratase